MVLGEILEGGAERPLHQRDLVEAAKRAEATTLEGLKTARNLVKYGWDGAYRDVEAHLKANRFN